jgi:hypothetical protein
MKENTHFDHKPGRRESLGYSTINNLNSTKATPSPKTQHLTSKQDISTLQRIGHFHFALTLFFLKIYGVFVILLMSEASRAKGVASR